MEVRGVIDAFAAGCYDMADAMLKAREETP
jgi:hypothetical protein